MLKWFRKNTYTSIGDALGDIQKELEALQPQDSDTITWDKTNTGVTAKLRSTSASGGLATEESTEVNAPAKVEGGYNSYFKIVDRTETNEDGTKTFKIQVVDGGGREYSRCKVNNIVFNIQDTEFAITSRVLIVLKYTAAGRGGVTLELLTDSTLPDDNAENSWYQIGEAYIYKDKLVIQQDHLSGVAQLFWYDVCGE